MAFRTPNFNIHCTLWGNQAIPPPNPARIAFQACQLGADRNFLATPLAGTLRIITVIRFPANTDVRGVIQAGGTDLIECPFASGRYYTCYSVEDVAKGFSNEYRVALCIMVAAPTPLP